MRWSLGPLLLVGRVSGVLGLNCRCSGLVATLAACLLVGGAVYSLLWRAECLYPHEGPAFTVTNVVGVILVTVAALVALIPAVQRRRRNELAWFLDQLDHIDIIIVRCRQKLYRKTRRYLAGALVLLVACLASLYGCSLYYWRHEMGFLALIEQYYAHFIMTTLSVQFIVFVRIISVRLKIIAKEVSCHLIEDCNDFLKLQANKTPVALRSLRMAHLELLEWCSRADVYFGWAHLLRLAYTFSTVLVGLHYTLHRLTEHGAGDAATGLAWAAADLGMLLAMVAVCSDCASVTTEIVRLLHRLLLQVTSGSPADAEGRLFLLQLSGSGPKFTTVGIVTLRLPMFLTFISSVTTYLVIVLQLK